MKRNKILSKIFTVSIPICMILFFSGKIIEIPYGTRQGGIISAIGVAVILIALFGIYCVINFALNYLKKR